MTDLQKSSCHKIIHSASAAGAGISFASAQVPGSDNVVLVGIEVAMTISLGAVFGVNLDKSFAKSIVASSASTLVGRAISQVTLGWVPLIGNAINATTAAGVIEGLGWAIANDFDKGKFKEMENK